MAENEQQNNQQAVVNCWEDLLGPQLAKHVEGGDDTNVSTKEALAGKYVALYFSAHWCPPCRMFTPQLAEKYKAITGEGKNWEVVFCSSDQDENAFKDYFKEMPWLSLPYSDRDRKNSLSSKYKVNGIPTLVLLDTDGSLMTTNGRAKVADPSAFPWKPLPMDHCFKEVTKAADNFDLNKGVKCIYFSAHWCGPCRSFTPTLAKLYPQLKEKHEDFEIIFVSSDRSQEQFDEYFATMPWAAIPYNKRAEASSIEEKFDNSSIPQLVILQDGKLINSNARGLVSEEGAEGFPWKKKAIQGLSMGTASAMNDYPCFVLFQEGKDADKQAAHAATMKQVADQELEKELDPEKERTLAFFVHNKEAERVTDLLRNQMLKELGDQSKLVIVNFNDDGGYYVEPLPESEDDFKKIVADFKAGNLTRHQASRS